MRFTSRGRQRRFEGSIRHCGLWECKLRTRKALGKGYQVRPDLVTKAKYIKVSRGTGIPKRTVTYVIDINMILHAKQESFSIEGQPPAYQ